MANLKEAADKTLHKVTVDIEGLEIEIDNRALGSYDMLIALGHMKNGDISAIEDVLDILFNEKKKTVVDHLRDDDGFVAYERIAEVIGEVIASGGQKN